MTTELALTPVTDSSALAGYAYNAADKVLHLQYKRGGPVYPHYGVPLEIVTGLVAAPSKGQFVGQHIRGKFSVSAERAGEFLTEDPDHPVEG